MYNGYLKIELILTNTGEDSKLVSQAKTFKSGHAIFFSFFDASERRVWLSAESKTLASTLGRFRLCRLKV